MVTATAVTETKAYVSADDLVQAGKALHDKLSFDLKQLHGDHRAELHDAVMAAVEARVGDLIARAVDARSRQIAQELAARLSSNCDGALARLEEALEDHDARLDGAVQLAEKRVRLLIKENDGRLAEQAKSGEQALQLCLQQCERRIDDALAQLASRHDELAKTIEQRVADWRQLCLAWMDEFKAILQALPAPQVAVEVQAPPVKPVKKTISYDEYGRPQTIEEHELGT